MDLLIDGCKELGILLTEKQRQQFLQYYDLLIEWNSRINLTSITEYKEVVKKHFLDSLCLVKLSGIDFNKISNVIDVGTGAGFPGIPLKIVFPDMQLLLLDSLNKRIKFLNAVIDELDLNHVIAIHGRAEDYGKLEEYREQFDLCVSRAVANLAVLSEYCIPFIKLDGNFVAYKSGKISEELKDSEKAIDLLGGEVEEKLNFIIPNSDISRALVSVRKVCSTSMKYPRKTGVPGKMPLV